MAHPLCTMLYWCREEFRNVCDLEALSLSLSFSLFLSFHCLLFSIQHAIFFYLGIEGIWPSFYSKITTFRLRFTSRKRTSIVYGLGIIAVAHETCYLNPPGFCAIVDSAEAFVRGVSCAVIEFGFYLFKGSLKDFGVLSENGQKWDQSRVFHCRWKRGCPWCFNRQPRVVQRVWRTFPQK